MKGRIAEVFSSVQGEGLYLGEEQLFVRFFGCNLCCKFCDTKLDRFTEYEPKELFEELKLYNSSFHFISFTGGEPLLQNSFLKDVLKLTHEASFKNYLDTNGTLSGELKDVIDFIDIVAMDVKLPSSTGMCNLWGIHRRFLKIASQKEVFLKAVICHSTEEEDLKETLALIKGVHEGAVLILQPNGNEGHGELAKKLEHFKNMGLKEGVTTCVIPQVHKIVGIE